MTSPVPSKAARGRSMDPALVRVAASLIATALFVWGGLRTWHTAAGAQSDLNRAKATLSSFADLRRKYQPAVAAESIAWRRTWTQVLELGVVGDERMAMTQNLSRAAEAAGLRNVRVLITPADTTGSDRRLKTEGVRRKSAPFGVTVQSLGGLKPVVAFLGLLPPSVAATQVSLTREGGGSNSISLAVYQLQFANNPPPSLMSASASAAPARADSVSALLSAQLGRDPLVSDEIPVAKASGVPTVSTTRGQERRLTAILIADNRPVAVINDKVVEVGTSLPDGARVSRIEDNRVWLVEKSGAWRQLTLSARTP